MKLAITGKGGVGKTTVSSLLARMYAAEGRKVLAIDANPDSNLGMALGIPMDEVRKITPIAEMDDLIEERTGAKRGTSGMMFKINPRVDDIPDRFSTKKDGIKLLVLGGVKSGGGGCICPESALLKTLMSHLLISRDEVVILDMDAGFEHIGRGTAGSVDAFIAVVEPGQRSIETAKAIEKLAHDIGIKKTFVVGNKVRNDTDRQFIAKSLPGFEVLGFISYSAKAVEADLAGASVFDMDPALVAEAKAIKARLDALGSKK